MANRADYVVFGDGERRIAGWSTSQMTLNSRYLFSTTTDESVGISRNPLGWSSSGHPKIIGLIHYHEDFTPPMPRDLEPVIFIFYYNDATPRSRIEDLKRESKSKWWGQLAQASKSLNMLFEDCYTITHWTGDEWQADDPEDLITRFLAWRQNLAIQREVFRVGKPKEMLVDERKMEEKMRSKAREEENLAKLRDRAGGLPLHIAKLGEFATREALLEISQIKDLPGAGSWSLLGEIPNFCPLLSEHAAIERRAAILKELTGETMPSLPSLAAVEQHLKMRACQGVGMQVLNLALGRLKNEETALLQAEKERWAMKAEVEAVERRKKELEELRAMDLSFARVAAEHDRKCREEAAALRAAPDWLDSPVVQEKTGSSGKGKAKRL